MPVTCIDIDGEASDVTADAASALAQKMADYHRKNIVYVETADGQHLLTVEGGTLPTEVRQLGFFLPSPKGWKRIRAVPRDLLTNLGLRKPADT
jgi:hypothetical protein